MTTHIAVTSHGDAETQRSAWHVAGDYRGVTVASRCVSEAKAAASIGRQNDADFEARLTDQALRHDMLNIGRALEAEPSLVGASAHLLGIGRKP